MSQFQKRQFIKNIRSIMPLSNKQEDILLRYYYHLNKIQANIIINFSFTFVWKHLLDDTIIKMIPDILNEYRWGYFDGSYHYGKMTEYFNYITMYICSIILNMYKLRKLKTFIIKWYYTKLKVGVIIARNRKSGLQDVRFDIKYNPRIDIFWHTAFTTHLTGGMEDGKYIVYTNREGTTQEAVGVFCLYTCNRKKGRTAIYNYLMTATSTTELKILMGHLITLGSKWCNDNFVLDVDYNFLMNYINATLHNFNKTTSYQRLNLFLSNRILAEYIWENNFSTPEERAILGVAMGISNKNLGGFKKAKTLNELSDYLNTKISR